MLKKSLILVCGVALVAACGNNDHAETASARGSAPESIIGKTWHCEAVSGAQGVETIRLAPDGQWYRKYDRRSAAGLGVVEEQSGTYTLKGDVVHVSVTKREEPATTGVVVMVVKANPKNEFYYKVQEPQTDRMTFVLLGDDGAQHPSTCSLTPINNQIAGDVLLKDAVACVTHKSMRKVLVMERANNPYVAHPDDCGVNIGHRPIDDVTHVGDLVKFRYDGEYFWTSPRSITRN